MDDGCLRMLSKRLVEKRRADVNTPNLRIEVKREFLTRKVDCERLGEVRGEEGLKY